MMGRDGGGGSNLIVQEDTIFISGMDPDTSEEEIFSHFGAIGVIKVISFFLIAINQTFVRILIKTKPILLLQSDKRTGKPKIWMYKDKATGKPKGEATVTYDDQNAAKSAIDWFDGKDFKGFKIKVQMAQHKSNWHGGGSRGGGRGGGGGGGGRGGGRGGFGGRGGDREDFGGRDDRRDGGGRGGDWRYTLISYFISYKLFSEIFL